MRQLKKQSMVAIGLSLVIAVATSFGALTGTSHLRQQGELSEALRLQNFEIIAKTNVLSEIGILAKRV